MADAPEPTAGPEPIAGPSDEQIVLEDLDAIRAIADPLRLRILFETTFTGRTVKELAAVLDVPQTRLYYHVKLLQRHKLLTVVERRMVSGIEERRYRSPAGGFTISPSLLGEAVGAGLLKAALDLTGAELGLALSQETSEPGQPDSTVPMLTFNRMWLSPEDVGPMMRELGELIERYDARQPGDGKREYAGVFAVYVHPHFLRGDDAS